MVFHGISTLGTVVHGVFARAWLECVAGREKVQPGSPAMLERRVEQKGQLCWQM